MQSKPSHHGGGAVILLTKTILYMQLLHCFIHLLQGYVQGVAVEEKNAPLEQEVEEQV